MFSHFIGFCPLIQFAKPHICLFQEASVKMYFHLSAPTRTDTQSRIHLFLALDINLFLPPCSHLLAPLPF